MIARFIINGPNVHGVQLRETVVNLGRSLRIKGQARNLLNGTVEVLFIYADNGEDIKKCLQRAILKLRENGMIDRSDFESVRINGKTVNEIEINDTYEDKAIEEKINADDFTIIREHELQEIVWALQGAGRVFQFASKKLEGMLHYKRVEVIGRLRSVEKELMHIQNNIADVDEPVCLKQFIADPLIDLSAEKPVEEDLLRSLIEFYYGFIKYKKDYNKLPEKETEIIKTINKLQEMINKEIAAINNG